jgi:ribosomal protein S18 acetylase RimI-like enzyme
VGSGVTRVELDAFGTRAFRSKVLQAAIANPTHLVVTLHDATDRVFGFLWVEPREGAGYLADIAIENRCRGKRLLGIMMSAAEEEMTRAGYRFLELDAAVENEFADKLERHYRDRIAAVRDHSSSYGPQRFIRITLSPS